MTIKLQMLLELHLVRIDDKNVTAFTEHDNLTRIARKRANFHQFEIALRRTPLI